jgi:class 3 adenylate cyclase
LAVGGLPEPLEAHAETILHIGLGMEWKARQVTVDTIKNEPLLVRCGIHTGPVIAGLVEVGSPE